MSSKKTTTLVETLTSTTRRRSNSDAAVARAAQQAELARVWHSLPATAKNGFQRLAAQTTPRIPNNKPRVSAFFFFANCNTALVNAGGEPMLTPVTDPLPAQMLPQQIALLSSVVGGAFSLQIQSSHYYSPVVLYAAAPAMAESTLFENAFRKIGFVSSLSDGGVDITALYTEAYGIPQEGEKIALQLMGVSGAGYTTTKKMVTALTTASAAAAASNAEPQDEAALKMA